MGSDERCVGRTCGVSDDRQEDNADELLADVSCVRKAVNRTDEEFGSDRDDLGGKMSVVMFFAVSDIPQ